MKRWWTAYLAQSWDKRMLWTSAVLALVPIGMSLLKPSLPAVGAAPEAAQHLDTHIPKGFVLVPIEVQNYEALDSVLGRFGVVDLYQAGNPGGAATSMQRLVARNVRLLRAPRNPSHFAVLVPESQAHEVLRFGGLFTVTLKRPGRAGTQFVVEDAHPKRIITYGGG